ncbi:MAG: helix-turn-helix transcriptional regulator, partial [Clostridiaceae bacterium]|nr:helix-turn-helix transcriptional regulator [Clostridiaceae bacterium]
IIVGRVYNDILKAADSYSDALKILEHKILLEQDTALFYGETEFREQASYKYSYETEEKIFTCLKRGDAESAAYYFDKFLNGIITAVGENKVFIINFCIKLISGINRMFELTGNNLNEIENTIYEDFIKNSCYLDDIKSWFSKYFKELADKLYIDEAKYQKYQEAIIKYLNDNYFKEVSMEMVASEIGISYSYLRKIFMKIFGCSFSYYINLLRVNKAKKLLEETCMGVSNIAVAVGYNNEKSFYRNFKKITGFTPLEYKRSRL